MEFALLIADATVVTSSGVTVVTPFNTILTSAVLVRSIGLLALKVLLLTAATILETTVEA